MVVVYGYNDLEFEYLDIFLKCYLLFWYNVILCLKNVDENLIIVF